MKKSALIFTVFCILGLSWTSPVDAAQRKNKPWFSGQKATAVSIPDSSDSIEVKRKPSTVSAKRVAPAHKGQQIVQQALRYRGTKYRYGGTTKSRGFDCSGLIARVWSDLNLKKVPRASSQLYQAGTPVTLADLREGDLVFFKNTYKSGISHVGVYAGKNKFIHAPSRGKRVSITRLSDPYYQIHYAGARRLY